MFLFLNTSSHENETETSAIKPSEVLNDKTYEISTNKREEKKLPEELIENKAKT